MLPEVTARLDADVSGFIAALDRAADAAQRAAARIRAAIASLPEVTRIRVEVDIDNNRLNDLNRELDRLTRSARAAGDAMRDFGNNARRSSEDVRTLGENSRRAADDVNRLGERARNAGAGLGSLGSAGGMAARGLGPARLILAALVASVLPAIAAAALAAGAAIIGMGVAGAVIAGGWRGIQQAGERLKATLGGLQKQLESTFRSGLSKEFQQLGKAISSLDGPLKGIAQAVVSVVKEFTGWIRSAQGMSEIETALGGIENMVKSLGGGAKALAQIFTGFAAAAAPAMDEIGLALSSVFENLKQVIDKGRETGQLEKAFQNGAKAIEAFGKVLAGIVEVLIEVAAEGGEPAADAIGKFGDALKDAAPAIGQMLKGLAQTAQIIMTVVGWLAKAAGAVGEFSKAIGGLAAISQLIKIWETFFAAIDVGFKKVVPAVKEGSAKAVQAVKEWWTKTTQDTKDGVKKVQQAVKDWWNKKVQDIKTGIAKAVQAVKDWWNKTVQDVKAGAQKVVQAVKDWWNKTVEDIKTGVEKAVEAVKEWVDQTIEDIKGLADDFVEAVKEWWDKTVEDVKTGVDKVVSTIKELPQKVKDVLRQWITDMKQAGKDAIDGMADGIKSAVGKLVGAATAAAKAAMTAIKSTLGIRSPSVVLRNEVGLMMGAGMAEGIIASAGLVNDAMRRVGLAGVATGRGGALGGAAAMGRGGGQQTFTLHVSGGADTAVGVMIARLAQQGKLKITANAVVR